MFTWLKKYCNTYKEDIKILVLQTHYDSGSIVQVVNLVESLNGIKINFQGDNLDQPLQREEWIDFESLKLSDSQFSEDRKVKIFCIRKPSRFFHIYILLFHMNIIRRLMNSIGSS